MRCGKESGVNGIVAVAAVGLALAWAAPAHADVTETTSDSVIVESTTPEKGQVIVESTTPERNASSSTQRTTHQQRADRGQHASGVSGIAGTSADAWREWLLWAYKMVFEALGV